MHRRFYRFRCNLSRPHFSSAHVQKGTTKIRCCCSRTVTVTNSAKKPETWVISSATPIALKFGYVSCERIFSLRQGPARNFFSIFLLPSVMGPVIVGYHCGLSPEYDFLTLSGATVNAAFPIPILIMTVLASAHNNLAILFDITGNAVSCFGHRGFLVEKGMDSWIHAYMHTCIADMAPSPFCTHTKHSIAQLEPI